MLTRLKLRDFRCFPALECEFAPGTNVITGPNAQGKTSLLEAACVLLRLQSPRAASLETLLRIGAVGFVLDGFYHQTHLQFYFSRRRKKLALDSVEQQSAEPYLATGQTVWFSNGDIALVQGPAEERRRYLDFVATQLNPGYRRTLRAYERALRSRNRLLKAAVIRWREVAAFDEPLLTHGRALSQARTAVVAALAPHAQAAHRAISAGARETLALRHEPSGGEDWSTAFEAAREADARLRQTTVGPHRDELGLEIDSLGSDHASEGQQRTIALALRLAHARLLAEKNARPPLLLLDDIFGELDPQRRAALLENLPEGAQRILTTTRLEWSGAARVFRLENGALREERS